LSIAAVLLVALDLLIVDTTLIGARAPEDVFADGRAAAEWLASRPGRFRVYSPSYSIPQHLAERYRLELADGVDPLQLSVYADYLNRAAGLQPQQDYSVTLPTFPEGTEVRTALQDVSPRADLLGQLGVKYVVAAFPLPESPGTTDAFHLVGRLGDVFIYQNGAFSTPAPRDGGRTITLADGRVLYAYQVWPVLAGGGISIATAIGAVVWFITHSGPRGDD
jgi:hypothetical protein